MKNKETLKITLACIALGAVSRLLPHPPNVTPLTAMALLGGAYLSFSQALTLPLLILFASDLFLGLHATIPFVYGSFLAAALMGQMLRNNRKIGWMFGACLSSSLLFFVVTNFGVWLTSSMYAHNVQGLAACYTAALPFLRNSLAGDLGFTAVLFGMERISLRALARPVSTLAA